MSDEFKPVHDARPRHVNCRCVWELKDRPKQYEPVEGFVFLMVVCGMLAMGFIALAIHAAVR